MLKIKLPPEKNKKEEKEKKEEKKSKRSVIPFLTTPIIIIGIFMFVIGISLGDTFWMPFIGIIMAGLGYFVFIFQ